MYSSYYFVVVVVVVDPPTFSSKSLSFQFSIHILEEGRGKSLSSVEREIQKEKKEESTEGAGVGEKRGREELLEEGKRREGTAQSSHLCGLDMAALHVPLEPV